ncbi:MFS general substrate transporter [Pseudovirgaria hyperparasitica]|uniref:MFS general substrate transporter n=1 Tax=Pseudovirgaria hyperparasitica TaxID=470096 RepID=A0A6A6WEN5_9PEZI|nr:MFS general substrate transporter [Pseudovirgaria hyperparasitica]KAF2760494.1 MFS general substrate transporter [Pseudovirgaria hyperparasitica]
MPLPGGQVKDAARYSSEEEPQRDRVGGEGDTFVSTGFDVYHKPIESYEGYHRYDPDFQWTEKEERKIVRKIDYRICSWVCLMFFALQLDRSNIQQALSDNMLPDLGLTTNDYNYGQTIFYLCFLCAELPSQLVSKKIGPDNWIPIQMVSWSLVASCQAFLTGRSSFFACRALLGLIEGGFIPDNVLYLSYWYKGNELPTRLSWFWVSYQATNIVGAFLAFGILRLRGHNSLEGWRWLFALEGMLTGLIGIVSFFYLAPSPTQTASWFRGKDGWFTEHEEKIMVNRVLRDDPSKGDMHNRQALDWRMLWACIADYHMWPIYLIGLSWLIPNQPATAYLSLQIRSLGFGTLQTTLLTIPAYALFILQLLFWTWLSERTGQRFYTILTAQLWALPLLLALEFLPAAQPSPWPRWTLSTLLVGHPYIHAILVSLTSRNAGAVRTRTFAAALYNMAVQASNIVGQNIYRDADAPLYRVGNRVLLGICVWNGVLVLGARAYYVRVNAGRERVWGEWAVGEREGYLRGTTERGNKRVDFRFAI